MPQGSTARDGQMPAPGGSGDHDEATELDASGPRGAGPPTTHRRKRPDSLLELMVAAICLALVLAMITVPLPGDPMNYLDAAENLPSTPLHHGSTRLGLTIPIWLLTLIFGYSEVSFYVVPFLAFAGLGAATALAGRRLFNRWVGLGAAGLVVTSPWALPFASQILPDIPSAALLTACLAVVIPATAGETGRARGWLAGLLFGLAYLTKETSLLFAPALVVVTLLCGHRLGFIARAAAAAAGVAVAEAMAGIVLWGDPLARLNALLDRSDAPPSADRLQAFQTAFDAQATPLKSFMIFVDLLWASPHGRLMMGLGLGLLLGLLRGGSRFRMLAAWTLIPWIALALIGSIHPESGRPVIRLELDRYWVPLLPPLAIAGLGAMAVLAGKTRRTRVTFAIAASIVLLGTAAGIAGSLDGRDWFVRFGNDGYLQLRSAFDAIEGAPEVFVHQGAAKLTRLYTNDPLGRSIFAGTLVSSAADMDDADVVLVQFATAGATSTVDAPAALARGQLLAASDDSRWAMYANPNSTIVGLGATEYDTSILASDAWQQRLVIGEDWGPPGPLGPGPAVVEEGEMLVVFDGAGAFGTPPSAPSLEAPAGSTVSFRVGLELESGSARVTCDFYDDSSAPRESVAASVLLDEGPAHDLLTGLCVTPTDSEHHAVRLVVVVRGPARVELGDARLMTYTNTGPAG